LASNRSDNLGALLAEAARHFSARDAIAVPGAPEAKLCFAELLAAAGSVRSALADAGLATDEPVHVRVSNHPCDLVAYLGVWLAGGVVVPLHRSAPEGAVAQVIAKTRARFEWDALGADGSLKRRAEERPPLRPILEGAALVVFTSGSSGLPKGAVLSHRAFAGKLAAIQSLLGFGESDRTLLVLNITFSFGIWVALLTLLHGGRLLAREKFSAAAFLRELAEERATRVAVVPTMMRSLILDLPPARLESEGRALAAAGALRHVLIGGETLGNSLGETLRTLIAPAGLIDIYGLTETSTCDFFLMPGEAARYPGCIGRPSPGVRYRIAGEDGQPVAPGAIGELVIASPFLMSGYLDEPALEPVREGWLATGDLARERDPGVLEIAGRRKELIYRGGNKVAPQEIELACSAHPKVAAAIVVGRPDARLGQRIHALVVPRQPGLAGAELREFLRARLEKYKQPDVLYFAAELPAGRTGKADRGRFAEMLERGELAPVEGDIQP
jgi:long-chain acyl-CoA synthetase